MSGRLRLVLAVLRIVLAVLGACACGCVAASATLQTAQTLAPKHVSVAGGISIPISTAFVRELGDTVRLAGRRARQLDTRSLSQAEKRQLIEAVEAVAVLSPAPVVIGDARIGVARNFDLGVRYAGSALGIDGKYQLLDAGWDVAASLGFRHHTGLATSIASQVYTVISRASLLDYGREDLRAVLLFSTDDKRTFGFYGAAYYELSFTKLAVRFGEEASQVFNNSTHSLIHTVGAGSGLRLGTRRFAFMLELAVSYVHLVPQILGKPADLSGFVLEPAAGIRLSF